jgi:hypothetical protein
VYDTNSVNAVVSSLSAIVQDAMDQAIYSGYITKSKLPHWFSNALKYYIRKEDYFYRGVNMKKSNSLYNKFSFHRKLVKVTIKAGRLKWFKSIVANLKLQPNNLLNTWRLLGKTVQLLFSLWLMVLIWSNLVKSPTHLLIIFS